MKEGEGGGGGTETRGGILNCFDSTPEPIGRTTPAGLPVFFVCLFFDRGDCRFSVPNAGLCFLSIVFPLSALMTLDLHSSSHRQTWWN